MRAGRIVGHRYQVGARLKVRPGLFWQLAEAKAGDTFEYHGAEFTVDNVVACPAGGYEVSAHPSAVIGDGE